MDYSFLIIIGLASSILMVSALINIFFLRFPSGIIKSIEEPEPEDLLKENIRRKKAAQKAEAAYLCIQRERADFEVMHNHLLNRMEKSPEEQLPTIGNRRNLRKQQEKISI